jgi:glutathionyl-hydroquinone reductase
MFVNKPLVYAFPLTCNTSRCRSYKVSFYMSYNLAELGQLVIFFTKIKSDVVETHVSINPSIITGLLLSFDSGN